MMSSSLLPPATIGYEATQKTLLTRTRGLTWDTVEDQATSAEWVPVHVFNRHNCEYHVQRSDLDGRREKIRLWKRCAE